MYDILCLNKISPVINKVFTDKYSVSDVCENPDAIMLRSFNMAEYAVGDRLVAIGRAGAGVNNIPVDQMSEKGIVVFNTPGANANAVKELVICAMLIASRNVISGSRWVNSLANDETVAKEDIAKTAEKGKGTFAGHEILGKTLGVIGLGAIGVLVANACVGLGMKVVGYDPYITDVSKGCLNQAVEIVTDVDDIYARSDIITLHVPLLDSTKGKINAESIAKMKDGVIIINFSRGSLANVADVKEAILNKKIAKYVVDFPEADVLNTKGIVVFPHLGASTEEAEDNCAERAAKELVAYIEEGKIINSVNYPNCAKPRTGAVRTCVLFKAEAKGNIDALEYSKQVAVRGNYGYAVIDADDAVDVSAIEGVLKVRVIK